MKISNKLITASDVKDQIGTSVNTLANWRSEGVGPKYIKVGHMVKYRQSDIDAWLTSKTVTPGVPAVA